LNLIAYQELIDILQDSAKDDNVNVVALTGAGDFYSAGNDFGQMLQSEDMEQALAKSKELLKNFVRTFIAFPKLLICVVNGPCIGIAATTAVLCDIIYASDTAYFYTPFSKLGICVEGCASYTFPMILGTSKASEVLLLNHKLTAREALQFNFVSEVIPKSELNSKLWPRIKEYAKLPRASLMITKRLVKRFDKIDLELALIEEVDELYKRFTSQDFYQALTQFMTQKSKL